MLIYPFWLILSLTRNILYIFYTHPENASGYKETGNNRNGMFKKTDLKQKCPVLFHSGSEMEHHKALSAPLTPNIWDLWEVSSSDQRHCNLIKYPAEWS